MVADLAAHFPALFSKLVLLAPAGLWLDDHPPRAIELISGPPERAPSFSSSTRRARSPRTSSALPTTRELVPKIIAAAVWAQGCAAKFLWPIPDHGLAKRAPPRDRADADRVRPRGRVIPSVYGQAFADASPAAGSS